MTTSTSGPSTAAASELSERIFGAAVAAFDLMSVYLGDRLGLYRALHEHGPATPDELAERARIDARYAREWLEHQAVTGILGVDETGRFSLPDGYADVLVDPLSLSFTAPLARVVSAAYGRVPDLVEAYRSGKGVGWESYGPDMREGQASFNRPAFTHLLGSEWLPAIPDIDARLRSEPAARIADIACGEGWSTLALARAYPSAMVIGVDLDRPSVEAARRHALEQGVTANVEFRHGDAASLAEPIDVALIIEAVHDMSNPVEVLRSVRESLAEGGSLIVVDERVAEQFTAPGDEIERFMYGCSISICLPDGRSRHPSAATGTVMRPDTLRRYATDAGFRSVEILPIENDFFRFYRLRP